MGAGGDSRRRRCVLLPLWAARPPVVRSARTRRSAAARPLITAISCVLMRVYAPAYQQRLRPWSSGTNGTLRRAGRVEGRQQPNISTSTSRLRRRSPHILSTTPPPRRRPHQKAKCVHVCANCRVLRVLSTFPLSIWSIVHLPTRYPPLSAAGEERPHDTGSPRAAAGR